MFEGFLSSLREVLPTQKVPRPRRANVIESDDEEEETENRARDDRDIESHRVLNEDEDDAGNSVLTVLRRWYMLSIRYTVLYIRVSTLFNMSAVP